MTAQLNRVLFRAASAGTGSFVVSSAIQGYMTPAQAGASNSTVYAYFAESDDRTEWEIGTGTYTTGNVTITRTVQKSSNSDNAVNFTAAPKVGFTLLADGFDDRYLQTEVVSASPSSSQNNYAPGISASATTYTILNLTPTACIVITGISTTSWQTGKRLLIRNTTSRTGSDSRLIILERQSSSSSSGNKFEYPGNKRLPVLIFPESAVEFYFDGSQLCLLDTDFPPVLQSFFDRRYTGVSSNDGRVSGTGATFSYGNNVADYNSDSASGISMGTGTDTTGRVHIMATTSEISPTVGCMTFLARCYINPNLSTVSEEFDVNVGYSAATATPEAADEMLCWRYDRQTSTNWQAFSAVGGATTSVDSGLEVVTTGSGSSPILGIFLNGDSTRAEFFYSYDGGFTWGVVSTAITTNMPSTTSHRMAQGAQILKSAGTTSRTMLLYWSGHIGYV